MTGYEAVYWRDAQWIEAAKAEAELEGGLIPDLSAYAYLPVVDFSETGEARVCGMDGVRVSATSLYGFQFVRPTSHPGL